MPFMKTYLVRIKSEFDQDLRLVIRRNIINDTMRKESVKFRLKKSIEQMIKFLQ